MANPEHQEEKIRLIERHLPVRLKGKDLLEIGSGIGDFIVTCRRQGVHALGIEPHNQSYGHLKPIAEKFIAGFGMDPNILREAAGENLPFPDHSFDVVFSYYVFEHVQDPLRVLEESLRVLRTGGFLFFVFPNYGSFWEGHYGVPWIPFINKFVGKFWIRMFGFDPSFIDTLQLIDLPSLKRLLSKIVDRAELVSLGSDTFKEEVKNLSFTEAGSLHRAKKLIAPLKKIGLLPFLTDIASAAGLYTPFYLTLRKK